MIYAVEVSATPCGPLADFDSRTDRIMDAFHDRTGIGDQSVGATLSTGLVEFAMTVDADGWGRAWETARTAVRNTLARAREDVSTWRIDEPERPDDDQEASHGALTLFDDLPGGV